MNTTRSAEADQATAASVAADRLSYREVLREFASMLGAQLAREHLAEARARKVADTAQDQAG